MNSGAVSRRSVLAVAGLVGLGTAGCAAPVASPAPTPTPSPSPTPLVDSRPRWPLTGVPLENPEDAKHAAVAVKVPDNEREHPQVGINEADIVFVELDGYLDAQGYSSTRLMPVFHSVMAEAAAPVRSVRPTDVPLLAPINVVMGSSGGSAWVMNYAKEFSEYIVSDLTYMAMKGTGAYSINSDRIRTYQGNTYYDRALVCHPDVLGPVSKAFPDGPPVAYLPYATSVDVPSADGGAPAARVSVPWKGDDYRMTYDFDDATGTYLRSMPWGEHILADGSRVSTDNVLVIKTKRYTDKLASGGGAAEPIHALIDTTGEFLYATGGRYVTGTWAKGAVEAVFEFTVTDGSPLLMTPGRTFVELPDVSAEISVE